MRLTSMIVGILLFLIGIVWTLQGINVMQDTPMSADPFWAIVGVVCIIVGATLAYVGWRRGTPAKNM